MVDQSLAEMIRESGLPPSTPVADLPGLTWHVTRPLAIHRAILTIGQLAELTDDKIRETGGIGERRLAAIKDAVRRATPQAVPAAADEPRAATPESPDDAGLVTVPAADLRNAVEVFTEWLDTCANPDCASPICLAIARLRCALDGDGRG